MKLLILILLVAITDSAKVNNTKAVKKFNDSANCTFTGNAAYFKIIREAKKDTIK